MGRALLGEVPLPDGYPISFPERRRRITKSAPIVRSRKRIAPFVERAGTKVLVDGTQRYLLALRCNGYNTLN
jgi:hypothetical protein